MRRNTVTLLTCSLGLACGAEEGRPPEIDSEIRGVCSLPRTVMFGTNDMFNTVTPDPYFLLPQFEAHMNSLGVTTANIKEFDDATSNRHMVATLRHDLVHCFIDATSLELCFRAQALPGGSGNDAVKVHNTDFMTSTFPIIASTALVPALTGSWSSGTVATLCVDLTTPMLTGQVSDTLHFRVQDDTDVDVIALTLN